MTRLCRTTTITCLERHCLFVRSFSSSSPIAAVVKKKERIYGMREEKRRKEEEEKWDLASFVRFFPPPLLDARLDADDCSRESEKKKKRERKKKECLSVCSIVVIYTIIFI